MSKEEQWKQRIAKWQQGGETQSAFCRRHGVSLATFKYWRDKVQEPKKERFVEILPAKAGEPFEVRLANGAMIRVPARFDSQALQSLVAALA